jgi:MFS family permease
MGWTRETFALALAIQNLSWGVLGIFAGMLADRFGAFRVLIGGALLYALGLVGMALSPTGLVSLTAGVLIGAAGRHHLCRDLRRAGPADAGEGSWAMGVAAAAGSFGQFLMVPVEGFDRHSAGTSPAGLAPRCC